jgi:hypothetical protein
MRIVQMLLLAAILLAVSSVAFELHQLRNALIGLPVATGGLFSAAPARETRAERNLRLQRWMRENMEDAKAVFDTPLPDPPKTPKLASPKVSPHEQPQPR